MMSTVVIYFPVLTNRGMKPYLCFLPISIFTSSLPGLNKASSIKSGLLVIPGGWGGHRCTDGQMGETAEEKRQMKRQQMFRDNIEEPVSCTTLRLRKLQC